MESLSKFPFALAAVIATVLVGLYRLLQIGKRDPRMPKGPKTLPILGNIHQIPSTGLFRQYVYLGFIFIVLELRLLLTSLIQIP